MVSRRRRPRPAQQEAEGLRIGAVSCGICALWMGSVAALAEAPFEGNDRAVRAASGQEIQLGVYANVNESCSGLPAPDLRITTAPTRGTLTVKLVALSLKADSKVCPEKKVPALGLYYRAGPESEGEDAARVEAVAGASAKGQHFTITVTRRME
jgi:hypothetical protein